MFMSQPRTTQEDLDSKEFFDFLDRREKIGDWSLVIFGIAVLSLIIFGSIALLS
jgi:hypothetical protein